MLFKNKFSPFAYILKNRHPTNLAHFFTLNMNSDIRCTSILSSITFSSDDDDDLSVRNNITEIEASEEAIYRTIANNNMILVNYFNQKNNQVTHGGSIPGHIVIYRDREISYHNLFDDYFVENSRYSNAMFC